MTSRRFQHDVPNRQPGMRRMDVRAYLGNNRYQVTMGDGTTQMATSSGVTPYAVGDSVLGYWSNASGVWVLSPNTEAAEPTTARAEVLVDGRADVGNTYQSNPPCIGWPVSSTGFAAQFADAETASSPTGQLSFGTRVAFHPSGRAVAISNADSNGVVEVWEWIPGVGFGDKYSSQIDATYVNAFVQSTYDPAFVCPAISSAPYGQMAWSPGGGELAICGELGSSGSGDSPLVVFKFSLTTGFDWQHPIMPNQDLTAFGDGHSVAWSRDGAYIFIGGDISPWIKAFPFVGNYIQNAVANPATLLPDGPVAHIEPNPAGTFIAVGLEDSLNPTLFVYGWTGTAWGALITDPLTLTTTEIHAVSWHAGGLYVLVVEKTGDGDVMWVYEFDPTGGGSWGAQLSVPFTGSPLAFPDRLNGAAFSPDGSLIVSVGQEGGANTARVFTFSGGTSTAVATATWTGTVSIGHATVAWRPV